MCPECEDRVPGTKAPIWLPCQHSFEIEYLDGLYEMDSLYAIRDGIPISEKVRKIPENVTLECPECHKPFTNVKRYSLVERLPLLQENIEGLYAKAGRKMNNFQIEIFRVENVLRIGFHGFRKYLLTMGLNPLHGKRDMTRIWERTEAIMPEQRKITNFRDEVVIPFQICIRNLVSFINNTAILPAQILPFKLRHDVLHYLCRFTLIEEAVRLHRSLQNASVSNQQVEILKIGLKMKAQDQIKAFLSDLDTKIDESKGLQLKRLEVEFRVLQITFWTILRKDFDLEFELDVASSLEECRLLCDTWPDSAGLFTQILEAVRIKYTSNEGSIAVEEWNRSFLRDVWRGWGRYQHSGRLDYCRFNHPYPRVAFRECPECGRESVLKAPRPAAMPKAFEEVNTDDCLQNAEFRAVIAKMRQASLVGEGKIAGRD